MCIRDRRPTVQQSLRYPSRVLCEGYLPDQAANQTMPDVVVRRSIVETRIVWISQSQVAIEGAFTEGGTEIVIGLGEGVMQRKLHAGVAEVISVKRNYQGVITRIAFIAARVNV